MLAIREKNPNIHAHRTCKQKSSRHNYYVVETKEVTKLLQKIRGGHNV